MERFNRGMLRGGSLGIAVGNLIGVGMMVALNRPAIGIIGFSFISGVMAAVFIELTLEAQDGD